MSKKGEAALLEQDDPKEKSTTGIVHQFKDAVKRNDLPMVFNLVNLLPKDAVELLRKRFLSIDKTTVAKCSNPEKYGCVLHPDGYALLRDLLPTEEASEPEEKPRKRRDAHKLICRIYGRLPDEKYLRLRRAIQADGYATIQDWITDQVDAYLSRKEKTNEQGNH